MYYYRTDNLPKHPSVSSPAQKAIRGFALAVGIFAVALLALVGYYKQAMPEGFYVDEEGLKLPEPFPITAVNVDERTYAAASAQSGTVNRQMLMLFGVIPIKEVEEIRMTAPEVITGGQPFGIKLLTDGVMVIRIEKVAGKCPARESGITEGDVIVSVNDKKITSSENLSEVIRESQGDTMEMEINRNGRTMEVELTPALSNGAYRAGVWVRDSTAGVGTVTFYEPSSGLFGGLGHPVCDVDTGRIIPIQSGIAAEVRIKAFNKSVDGEPGELIGSFDSPNAIGKIYENTEHGVFGTMTQAPAGKTMPLGMRQEIVTGSATILTTIDGKSPQEYSIEIESINLSGKDTKHMVIRITDSTLLEQTGGILQGMSGSPILQNGKLVGAVTHVFVQDPTRGYGIFADTMYENLHQLDTLLEEDQELAS